MTSSIVTRHVATVYQNQGHLFCVCGVARFDGPHNLYRCESFENLFINALTTLLQYFSLGGSKMVRPDWSLPVNQIAVGWIRLFITEV